MQSACAVVCCHLWPAGSTTFCYITSWTAWLGGGFIEYNFFLFYIIFYTIVVWNISLSKKNSARYFGKCAQVFVYSASYSCQIVMKFEFLTDFRKNLEYHLNFWRISEKISNIKFELLTDFRKISNIEFEFLTDFRKILECQIWIFDGFTKNSRISNFMEICPVGANLFPFGRTDR